MTQNDFLFEFGKPKTEEDLKADEKPVEQSYMRTLRKKKQFHCRHNLSAKFKVPGLNQISLNMGLERHPNKCCHAASWKIRSLQICPQ